MGIVENMSAFIWPHCGEATEIFGRGGGEAFARKHELEFFGGIPLDVKVRQGGDAGIPAVAQREPGAAAVVLRQVARQVAARMSVRAARSAPVLSIS
jgi:ATP-binding protein involved in chromosome partitioning